MAPARAASATNLLIKISLRTGPDQRLHKLKVRRVVRQLSAGVRGGLDTAASWVRRRLRYGGLGATHGRARTDTQAGYCGLRSLRAYAGPATSPGGASVVRPSAMICSMETAPAFAKDDGQRQGALDSPPRPGAAEGLLQVRHAGARVDANVTRAASPWTRMRSTPSRCRAGAGGRRGAGARPRAAAGRSGRGSRRQRDDLGAVDMRDSRR
jgi:hypothetical protein